MIVSTIGNNQKCLLWIFCLAHFADTQINGIEQRRPAFWDREEQPALHIVSGLGKVRYLVRLVRERDHEELVLRIGGLEEFLYSFASALNLAAHAAAHVENYAQRNRRVLTREMADILLVLAFKNLEIFFVQASHQAIHWIGDSDRNQNQIHLRSDQRGMGAHRVVG